MDLLRYSGRNATAVNARLATWMALPREHWLAIETAQPDPTALYVTVTEVARRADRFDDWRSAADLAGAIMDRVEIYRYPAVSAFAVGVTRSAIAARSAQ